MSDITARKKAEETLRQSAEELARSNKDLEQFAYVASHDLQEPLRAVAGFLGLLKRRYQEKLDTDAREFIDFAVEGATRLRTLITDLLAFSRVGSRGRVFAPMQMKDAVDAAIDNLQVSIAETNATVSTDPLPVVTADLSQMTQLMQNLIGNAIKFRGRLRPEIRITAHRDGRQWVIGVGDNGIGIAPQHFKRIFLIFQRLHSRTDYPGTGIGLALCKKIVERHCGTIWVESKPGEGTTFSFTLPDQGENSESDESGLGPVERGHG